MYSNHVITILNKCFMKCDESIRHQFIPGTIMKNNNHENTYKIATVACHGRCFCNGSCFPIKFLT